MEFGVYSLSEILENPKTKQTITTKERLEMLVEMARYADRSGLDLFGVGEHHRLDYAVSSPQMLLSAISQQTSKIKLTALTTLLNTADPVRLFEDFATLDLLSGGRVEFTAGRGAFVESFPLFGYNERDYDQLFEEHLQLFLQMNKEEKVTWNGKYRSALAEAEIAPRPLQDRLPISIGVGGTIESAERAGYNGCGLTVVMIGGISKKYQPLVQRYREVYQGDKPQVAIAGHTFIRETETELERDFYLYYANYWEHLTKQGIGGAMGAARTDLAFITSKESTLFVGTPEQIVEKILYQYQLFAHNRFYAQADFGGQPIESIKETIDLLADKVIPEVNRRISTQF
ncbi:Flavin-dependent oxidoreductase, luciferase family (includes alkanesulfonate monooxygenase SsuD and methylene tetrahydromethanopterin reductase) [Gracilibacillus orientalis]|uniref:Flavin-dependent oxidoreductase, luciferase family (Includes alkanesulfonate monooxygenase SsuD and methylene tetrahydromethanopterin reductase) n=1 Tax=Gracilibacillus orientalis TaxID=334253 RepID=A0A1I4GZD0_9BACI|nr:LLM class flavin-dependent oxidoreductase [Gracilibacillus orientalis]SFL34491.1 Flavin-dependent oxidoreductase, luciferase family (includes alkanesulfonate monooxygenase SsuD and methylene tetrahydromethanopterin reductase) [Gracilibacillus orientalis]